jgi:hypothetical protein
VVKRSGAQSERERYVGSKELNSDENEAVRRTAAKRLFGTCKKTPAKEENLGLQIAGGRGENFRKVHLP